MDEIFERMCGVVKLKSGQEPDEALRPLFSELWALLDWTTPGLLGPLKTFRALHAREVEGGADPRAVERRAAVRRMPIPATCGLRSTGFVKLAATLRASN